MLVLTLGTDRNERDRSDAASMEVVGTRKVLQNLTCVTEDEVRHLIWLAPSKLSDLDPIPTISVKD